MCESDLRIHMIFFFQFLFKYFGKNIKQFWYETRARTPCQICMFCWAAPLGPKCFFFACLSFLNWLCWWEHIEETNKNTRKMYVFNSVKHFEKDQEVNRIVKTCGISTMHCCLVTCLHIYGCFFFWVDTLFVVQRKCLSWSGSDNNNYGFGNFFAHLIKRPFF